MNSIKVEELYVDNRQALKFEKLTGEIIDKEIKSDEVHRPGLALSGFVDIFSYQRIQVLGNTEIAYLDSLSKSERSTAFQHLVEFNIPCIIITNKNTAYKGLVELCKEKSIPLFRSPLTTTQIVRRLGDYLEERFAPTSTKHGTLVDVYGIGVLLTGRSGIGKSEVALDLVERGHRLVADDLISITRNGDLLIGKGNAIIQHYIEIRGLGIIDVKSMFGIRAVRKQKRIEVEVLLEDWDLDENYERLGLQEHTTSILDLPVPQVHLPIFPGKNITVIVETIALTTLLKQFGHSPPHEFDKQLIKELTIRRSAKMKKQTKISESLNSDIE